MTIEFLILYAVFSFFYIISPGPAIFLAISNGMTTNMKTVALSSLGNVLGLLLLSLISILGLGTIITTSATLFMIVKIVGALYLVYLGVRQFRNSKKIVFAQAEKNENSHRKSSSFFHEAFLVAATNPKAILFFTAIFPQFLNPKAAMLPQYALLTAIFMFLSFASLFSYGLLSKSMRRLFFNEKRMAWFHRITGGIFIGMGVGLLQLKLAQN